MNPSLSRILSSNVIESPFDAERFSLDWTRVKVGEVVHVAATGLFYLVKDLQELDNEAGYLRIGAGDAVDSVNGLTGAVVLDTSNIAATADKRYVTDAQLAIIGNTTGINTGDNAVNSLYSGLVSNATHTGDATGATALTVVGINSVLLSGLATGILKNTTGTGAPSIAVAGDFPTLNQNTSGTAGTATALQTARAINGTAFDGTADITVVAAGSTLSDAVPTTKGGTSLVETSSSIYYPIMVCVRNVTVLTSGTPADVATITLPTGFGRFVTGLQESGAGSGARAYASAAAGTLAAATFQIRDAAGGSGNIMFANLLGPTANGGRTSAASSGGGSAVSGNGVTAITIRQTTNSANSGTLTFHIMLWPIPD